MTIAVFADLHEPFSELNNRASYKYAMAAEIKNIEMFIQSGDWSITPLYV